MMTRAGEDYLKAIYALGAAGGPVSTGAVAHALGVSSPSVSAMVKRLATERLLERREGRHDRGLRLTAAGEAAALRVIRRHRLLETFLAAVLEMGWDEVHAEAELLEHAVSARLEDRIDTALGHPTRDPHGDPIPPRHGTHDETWGTALAAAPVGARFLVDRVSDRDPAALRYLGYIGVVPGTVLEVTEQAPFGGPRWVTLAGRHHPLGAPLTRLVHGRVRPHPADTEPADTGHGDTGHGDARGDSAGGDSAGGAVAP